MKRKIIRFFCMKTGPFLRDAGILTYLVVSTADIETSSLSAILIAAFVTLGTAMLGVYLEKALPIFYYRHYRKNKRRAKIYRMDCSLKKAA